MLIPIRCFTCGNLIADKYEDYQKEAKTDKNPVEILESLHIHRYCCRRMLLSTVETSQQVIPFYEAIQKRYQEVQAELE